MMILLQNAKPARSGDKYTTPGRPLQLLYVYILLYRHKITHQNTATNMPIRLSKNAISNQLIKIRSGDDPFCCRKKWGEMATRLLYVCVCSCVNGMIFGQEDFYLNPTGLQEKSCPSGDTAGPGLRTRRCRPVNPRIKQFSSSFKRVFL